MPEIKVYIAFDYDDLDVKGSLVAQSHRKDCPFRFKDTSIARAVPSNWVAKARELIQESDKVIVLCGPQTHQAQGVLIELQLAQELRKPYFLLRASRTERPTRPPNARATDRIWQYRWPTVDALLSGRTPPADAAYEP